MGTWETRGCGGAVLSGLTQSRSITMPNSTGKHRQWLTKVPSDTIKIRELWELEHDNRRKVMQQRADVRANKEAEERRAKKEQQARYMAMCKAARRHRRALARQHRNEVRFARTLEDERVHQRAQAGDKWVERRMCHTSDLQKMASEIKLENAQLRQQQMKHRWDKMEQERLVRQQNNRVVMLDRLRPLTALGTDVAALITTSLPSPMEQRMAAIADIHAIRSRKQRSDMHVALARSKEKQQLTDLSCTRTTAENRAVFWILRHSEFRCTTMMSTSTHLTRSSLHTRAIRAMLRCMTRCRPMNISNERRQQSLRITLSRSDRSTPNRSQWSRRPRSRWSKLRRMTLPQILSRIKKNTTKTLIKSIIRD